jgi:hypothetical protein
MPAILLFYYFAILLFYHFTILPLYYFAILLIYHFTILPFYYLAILLSYYLTILLSCHYFTIPPLYFTLPYLSSSCSTNISPLPPSSPPALPPSANLNCSFVLLSQMSLISNVPLSFISNVPLFFHLRIHICPASFCSSFISCSLSCPVLHGYYIPSTPRSLNYWQLFSIFHKPLQRTMDFYFLQALSPIYLDRWTILLNVCFA